MRASASKLSATSVRVTPDAVARALLYLMPLAVGFGQSVTLSVKGLRASLTDALVAALVALGAYAFYRARAFASLKKLDIRRDLRQFWRVRPDAFALLASLLAYLLVIILSIVTAYTRAPVIKETLKWSEVIVVVCAVWGFIRTERQALWLAWSVIAAGLAEALLGCGQYIFASGLLGPGGSNVRVDGTFGQPNPYGGFLNLSLPVALALALFGRDPRIRWVAGGASFISLFALYLADSRGAWLGLAAALVVIAAVGWRLERQAAIAGAIAIPLIAIAWVTHLIPRSLQDKLLAQVRLNDVSLTAQVNDANFSTIERLAHWVAGIRMFQAHPILGVGAGNYDAAYQQYKVPGWDESLTHAHNYYINVAAETGMLGLLAFLAVCGAALYLAWRATRMTDRQRGGQSALASPDMRALAIGFSAVIVALCVHNLTDNLFVHAMELQFALTLGALLRLCVATQPTLLRLGVEPKAPGAPSLLAPDAS
jgi:O-antigen ligase